MGPVGSSFSDASPESKSNVPVVSDTASGMDVEITDPSLESSSGPRFLVPVAPEVQGGDTPSPPFDIPDFAFTPKGDTVLGGRVIRRYKGSTRVPYIWPDLWYSLSPNQKLKEIKDFNEALRYLKEHCPSDPRGKCDFMPTPANMACSLSSVEAFHYNAYQSDTDEITLTAQLNELDVSDSIVDSNHVQNACCSPALPVIQGTRPSAPSSHRTKESRESSPVSALVHHLLTPAQIKNEPLAQEALAKEARKHQDGKTWLEDTVREASDVIAESRRTGEEVHFGNIFLE